jgi:hypothetical protein
VKLYAVLGVILAALGAFGAFVYLPSSLASSLQAFLSSFTTF